MYLPSIPDVLKRYRKLQINLHVHLLLLVYHEVEKHIHNIA